MEKQKPFDIKKYVHYRENTKKSMCLMVNCRKELSGKRPANIKRHYKLVHKINIGTDDVNVFIENESGSNSNNRVTIPNSNVSISMDKNEFLKCCVGLVTVKNISLRIFDDDDFFKKIIAPYEHEFNIDINSKKIGLMVEKTSQQIKETIIKHVENKMISLKVDIATRMEKSILGINLQYIKDYQICVNTIGVIEISKKRASQFLKKEIFKCLQDYKIDIKQIYSNITDNANDIKASKILQEIQEEGNDRDEKNIHPEIAAVLSVVRCAVHTLQLAAYDVLKVIDPEVDECRNLVKKLKTSVRTGDININMPTLDNAARWSSTYNMINSIMSQKGNIDKLDDIVGIDWNFVENFVSAFRHLIDCSLKCQREQYILGDFYRDWLTCELELEDIRPTNYYAALLYEAMIRRKEKLFEHDTFVAALYMDPRFNFKGSTMLSEEQKTIAQSHLIKTYVTIKNLEESPASEDENEIINLLGNTTNPANSPTTSKEKYSKLTQHIRQMTTNVPSNITAKRGLKQKLSMLSDRSMEPPDCNVLEYWKKFYRNDSQLSKLAQVALAVPVSEVSMERSFSALSTIGTKLRTKLSKKTRSNILLTKLNFDIIRSSNLDFIAHGLI